MLYSLDNLAALRKKAVYLYSSLLALGFLWRLPIYFEVSYTSDVRFALFPLFNCLLAACAVILIFTKKEFQLEKFRLPLILLSVAFVWLFLRFMMSRFVFENSETMLIFARAFLAFFLFFPVAFILDVDERKICLSFITAAWVFVMMFYALIGVICAYTGSVLCVLNGSAIGITHEYSERLSLSVYPTISAQNAFSAGALAVFGAISARSKLLRGVYIFCAPILFIACALTDSRASIIAFSCVFAALAFIYMISKIRTNAIVSFFCASGAALAVLVAFYFAASFFMSIASANPTHIVNLKEIRNSQAVVAAVEEPALGADFDTEASDMAPPISSVIEEEDEDSSMQHRKIEFSFSGRTGIWKTLITALAENRENMLLIGATPFLYHRFAGLDPYYSHAHNIYLQVLVDFGLPGFIIFIVFLILFAKSALKLIFDINRSISERAVAVLPITILVSELMECFCQLNGDNVSLYILMLFIGLTLAEDNSVRKEKSSK